jgi:alpha-beta hydrolase superfamily lysophospholipase
VRRLGVVLFSFVVFVGGGMPAKGHGKPPVLLMFHGGGFSGGQAGDPSMQDAVAAAKRKGFRAVDVNYPLGNLDAAMGSAKRLARKYGRHGRPVMAYGQSAGGVLAGRLAQKGLVGGAVGQLAPTNLTTDIKAPAAAQAIAANNPTPRQLKRLALAKHRTRNPILLQIGRQDAMVDQNQQAAWARKDPRVKASYINDTHIYPAAPPDRAQALNSALKFLLHQGRRSSRR